MSDFLGSLASRSVGPVEGVRPRLAALFEPQRGVGEAGLGMGVDEPMSERVDSEQPVRPARAAHHPTPEPWPEISAPAQPDPQPPAYAPRAPAPPIDLIAPPAPRHQAQISAPPEVALAPAQPLRATPPILPAQAIGAGPIAPSLRVDPARPERPAGAPTVIERIAPTELRDAPRPAAPIPPAPPELRERLIVERAVPPETRPALAPAIPAPEARSALAPTMPTADERPAPMVAPHGPQPRAEAPTAGPLRPTPAAIIVQPRIQSHVDPPAPPAAAPEAPIINVTIGRIEVRAAPPAAQPPQRQRAAAPAMSLDDYLRQRAKGGSG